MTGYTGGQNSADVGLAEWAAAYSDGVREFSASRFVVIQDGDLVRFAFGHNGPPIDVDGRRGVPVYSVAVSMSRGLAAQLKDLLNKIILVGEAEGADNVRR